MCNLQSYAFVAPADDDVLLVATIRWDYLQAAGCIRPAPFSHCFHIRRHNSLNSATGF